MRVNVYAEEMTDHIEIISKKIGGQEFTGLRIYLALPASFVPADTVNHHHTPTWRPATPHDSMQAKHFQAPFIHQPGDDDSSAVTFWGKRDLRMVLRKALDQLDAHYEAREKRL